MSTQTKTGTGESLFTTTPGPWTVPARGGSVRGTSGLSVATVTLPSEADLRRIFLAGTDRTGKEVQYANARLISMAPELVEALRGLPDPTAYAEDAYGQRMLRRDVGVTLTAARAILARVEGK